MYIVVSDYTNEKVDISYQKFFDGMPSDEATRYENATRINTDSYADFCGCALTPYPEYVIGVAVDNGEDNHMYYMVFENGGINKIPTFECTAYV